ncbi:hypothetical protein TL16_g07277 [Triparma laevis f. inornata]|uniref:Uncharacterized protein n=1 Tax=Triparma laevis f. inornata TaxID=1714386 RepID=A0A9W7AXY0_9STRA|nr:hypothetical protein TL16_g07277 [Triparma laevis f. inornata]
MNSLVEAVEQGEKATMDDLKKIANDKGGVSEGGGEGGKDKGGKGEGKEPLPLPPPSPTAKKTPPMVPKTLYGVDGKKKKPSRPPPTTSGSKLVQRRLSAMAGKVEGEIGEGEGGGKVEGDEGAVNPLMMAGAVAGGDKVKRPSQKPSKLEGVSPLLSNIEEGGTAEPPVVEPQKKLSTLTLKERLELKKKKARATAKAERASKVVSNLQRRAGKKDGEDGGERQGSGGAGGALVAQEGGKETAL